MRDDTDWEDLHALMETLIEVAKAKLSQRGLLTPVGATFSQDGRVRLVDLAGSDGNANAKVAAVMLVAAMRRVGKSDVVAAIGTCHDARIRVDGRSAKAIALGIEDRKGHAMSAFVPYKRRLWRAPQFGRPIIGPRGMPGLHGPGLLSSAGSRPAM